MPLEPPIKFITCLPVQLKNLPIGVAAASLGAATLSNVYAGLGFPVFRHVFMLWLGICLLLFMGKIILHFSQVKGDYTNPALAPIYSILLMGGMLFSSWLKDFLFPAASVLFWLSLGLYIALMVVFVARHVFSSFSWETFTPAYYVPTLGLVVATVSGGAFLREPQARAIIIFGIITYLGMLPPLIYRLIVHPYPENMLHAKTILIAPVSLCIISLINYPQPLSPYMVPFLYGLLTLSLIYVLCHLFAFFRHPFTPGFAGLTFPTAIASLASLRGAGYFKEIGLQSFADFAQNLAGFQIFISTAFIGFVFFHFLRMYPRAH